MLTFESPQVHANHVTSLEVFFGAIFSHVSMT